MILVRTLLGRGRRSLFQCWRTLVTKNDLTTVENEDRNFVWNQIKGAGDEVRPTVLIFGWAGSKHKHLEKYAEVYSSHGCNTIQYILPTRFIFRYTHQVPDALSSLSCHLSALPPSSTYAVHCLSDTGVMSFQGLMLSLNNTGSPLTPAGIVWDSCMGPRPVVTIPKGVVLAIINWLSRMRDGMSPWEAVTSSGQDFKDLAWDNYIRRLKGQDTVMVEMEDTWTGHWARDQTLGAKELFLYSKSDFYMPYRHLESEAIPARKRIAKEVSVKCWDKSPHVGHLRAHTEEYKEEISKFLKSINFVK